MEINEFEAGMMDAVLEAFGGSDQLTQTQILELFGGDEELAAAVIDVLVDVGLVTKTGPETANGLPALLTRDSRAVAFLNDGGFTGQLAINEGQAAHGVEAEQALEFPKSPVNEPLAESTNQAVHNESPEPEIPITFAAETSALDNKIPVEEPIAEPPVAPSSKQIREVIFEVEFPGEDEPFTQSEILFQPPVEEDEPEELATIVSEQLDEPVMLTEQAPVINTVEAIEENSAMEEPVAIAQVLVEEPLSTEEIEQPAEPVIAKPDISTYSSADDTEALQQELAQLRKDQIIAERKVREKDAMIHTLASHNEQLGRLRTFIWVLLGLIAILIIGLIVRSH